MPKEKWKCVNEESNNYGATFSSAEEALEALGWWQNENGSWGEDNDEFTLSEALSICQLVKVG